LHATSLQSSTSNALYTSENPPLPRRDNIKYRSFSTVKDLLTPQYLDYS